MCCVSPVRVEIQGISTTERSRLKDAETKSKLFSSSQGHHKTQPCSSSDVTPGVLPLKADKQHLCDISAGVPEQFGAVWAEGRGASCPLSVQTPFCFLTSVTVSPPVHHEQVHHHLTAHCKASSPGPDKASSYTL